MTHAPPRIQLIIQQYPDSPAWPDVSRFQTWADYYCEHLSDPSLLNPAVTEVCLRIVNEADSAALNTTFRQRPGPTNVLSFPNDPEDQALTGSLGDLALCQPVIEAEAEAQGIPLAHHLAHLTCHGLLHLLGYDHIEEEMAAVMEALETRLLAGCGIPDPYGSLETTDTD